MNPQSAKSNSDALVGAIVLLPEGDRARVIGVEHEYDDGTTLLRLDGPFAGALTMRDTFQVRRYVRCA